MTPSLAARLPEVNVTTDLLWGHYVNEYLNGSLGLNGTELTVDNATIGFIDMRIINGTGVPPTGTLRLFVLNDSSFPRYSYTDALNVTRTFNDDEIIVKNVRGTNIAAHRIVYVTGHESGVPTVNLADASNISEMPAVCVTIEAIANGSFGRCMQVGLLENVNTNAFDVGTIYVSAITPGTGTPTNTAPITPNLTQEIGTILVKSATLGKIQIISRALTGDEYGTINNFIVQGNVSGVGVFHNFVGTVNASIINASAFYDDGVLLQDTDTNCSVAVQTQIVLLLVVVHAHT
jgi:hypothetical protein